MPVKGMPPKKVVSTEMHKWKHGSLHSGSKHGPLVHNRKQAIAIALSEARKAGKKASGGKTNLSKSKNIEDRRDEETGNRFNDSLYFPPTQNPAPSSVDLAINPLAEQAGAPALDRQYLKSMPLGFADGGDVDDADQRAMMPETFNPISNWTRQAAQKDYANLSGTVNSIPQLIDTARNTPFGLRRQDVTDIPGSEQPIDPLAGQAFNTASNITLGAGAIPAEANTLRTGIGVTSQGKHLTTLEKFQQKEANGVHPQINYMDTGWYRGEDGQPRFWVSDKGAKLKTENIPTMDGKPFIPDNIDMKFEPQFNNLKPSDNGYMRLEDAWDHPELYKAYPWLKDMEVRPYLKRYPDDPVHGSYDPNTEAVNMADNQDWNGFHDTLHHEVVHAIQHHEDFANGSSVQAQLPSDFGQRQKQLNDLALQLQAKLANAGAKIPKRGYGANELLKITSTPVEKLDPESLMIRTELRQAGALPLAYKVAQVGARIQKDQDRAFSSYLHTSGESEARDAPFIRNNPINPWEVPLHKNPEIIDQSRIKVSPPIPFRRSSAYGKDAQLPPDFIPDGVFPNQAKGGKVNHKQIDEDPQDHEFIDFSRGGLIDSHIPGRTDKIPMRVRPGSYVLPADIPSALGEGNSKAGAEILKKMFTHSAYGLPPPNIHGHEFRYPHSILHRHARGGKVTPAKVLPASHQLGMKVPKGGSMCANCKYLTSPKTCGNKGFIEWHGSPDLPEPADEYCCDLYGHKIDKKADGGAADVTPIVAAGGEFILHPDVVKAIGHGDIKKGHKVLDKFVLHTRKEHINTLKNLKPPK